MPPKRIPETSGKEFGTQIGANMGPQGLIFEAIFASFGKLVFNTCGFSSIVGLVFLRGPGQGETAQKAQMEAAVKVGLQDWRGG
mgnify:CR=1 FL=1